MVGIATGRVRLEWRAGRGGGFLKSGNWGLDERAKGVKESKENAIRESSENKQGKVF